ncbi:prepilin peptidase [Tessaracoccus sp. SD287]|uniref:prepilin peptidase n=1 Tax=Tessaracoccus sp. SD287 TaxID=2782008 RepID=UPI001A96914A|nr:A24 family peptidase [Tessaracoccus sp. SD287]MBO1031723.1 prepilin peptidase [Tessaracoccus sp. SD287]
MTDLVVTDTGKPTGSVLRWWHWLLAIGGAALGIAAGVAAGLGLVGSLAFAVVAGASAMLVAIDIATHTLPHRIVLPTLVAAVVLLGVEALLGAGLGTWGRALLGALVATAVLFVLAFINPAGLGLGDVAFVAPLGLVLGWLGWGTLAVGLLAAFVLNGLLIGLLLALRRSGRGAEVPFGPSLVLGAVIAVAQTLLV